MIQATVIHFQCQIICLLHYTLLCLTHNKYSQITCDCTSPSEKAMATHSRTLAWRIPWTEEPGRLHSMGWLRLDTTERLHFHFSLSCIGEGNGNPLQCSCLENHRNGGAWWAAVSGVAQSRTRLKQLSSSSLVWISHFIYSLCPQWAIELFPIFM